MVVGLATAISLYLFFNYSREAMRFTTFYSKNIHILDENALHFFNLFFAALSTSLGFSMSLWVWMKNPKQHRRKERLSKQWASTNILVVFWVVILMISRIGSLIPLLLTGSRGLENSLNLNQDYWLLFVILPLYIFVNAWSMVRLVYRSWNWIFTSTILCTLLILVLVKVNPIKQEVLNHFSNQRYADEYNYIKATTEHAKIEYGVDFEQKTISELKKWYTIGSDQQIISLNKAFSQGRKIPLDTIILQKMVIRNFKRMDVYTKSNSIESWLYPLPMEIYEQFKYHTPESDEIKELIAILQEQISLFNAPKLDYKKFAQLSYSERLKRRQMRRIRSKDLMEQLNVVKDSIAKNPKYNSFIKRLPEINSKI